MQGTVKICGKRRDARATHAQRVYFFSFNKDIIDLRRFRRRLLNSPA